MKRQILVAALLVAGMAASAQNREKKEIITRNTQLDYTVSPEGKKDGLYYVKNTDNDKVLVQGRYKEGERTGTWYFFDGSEKLAMRYNYDQKKLLYIDKDALKNISVRVLSDDAAVAKNASAPLPLCPIDYYVKLIGNEIYTHNYDPTNDNLTAEITAHIDTKGKATYTVAYLYKDRKSAEQRIDMTTPFPVEWVPSTYDSKALPSEFTVYAKIGSQTVAEDNFKRFKWDNEE